MKYSPVCQAENSTDTWVACIIYYGLSLRIRFTENKGCTRNKITGYSTPVIKSSSHSSETGVPGRKDSSAVGNKRHYLTPQNISVKQHCPSPLSVCTVCVCVRACVRACVCACVFCIVTFAPLLMHVSFKLFLLITFSISMYIMCVILWLFSALSRRVGALQISITIIIKNCVPETTYYNATGDG